MEGETAAPPKHLAIIMDGNGRWARQRGLPRQAGHERGVEALRRTVEACKDTSLEYLTVFSFSSENWKRPAAEISHLFSLLRLYVKQDLNRLTRDGVRVRVMGERNGLPSDVLELIELAEKQTAENTRFGLNIAFNYGSRDEILHACRSLIQDALDGDLRPADITSEMFASRTWFSDVPDPEILVRTSGESRISNFLLWQIAYSELVFVDRLWPDFSKEDLVEALQEFSGRQRRFGGLSVEK